MVVTETLTQCTPPPRQIWSGSEFRSWLGILHIWTTSKIQSGMPVQWYILGQNVHEHPISFSRCPSQIVENVPPRNVKEFFNKSLDPDPEAHNFQTLIRSSLPKDTSLVRFIIIIIIHEFHRDASLEQNFRAAKIITKIQSVVLCKVANRQAKRNESAVI